MELGKINRLRVDRKAKHGLYLMDTMENSVLLPIKYAPEDIELDAEIDVFVYKDNEGRPIATTLQPLAEADSFAALTVQAISGPGCFLGLGVEKDLLLPFGQQNGRPQVGDQVVVRILVDQKSDRLVASQRVEAFLSYDPDLEVRQEVNVLVYQRTDLGFKVIVEGAYAGMLYHSELFQDVHVGGSYRAQVKGMRPDGRLDLIMQKMGYAQVDDTAQQLLDKLQASGGYLPFHDKSDPTAIQQTFGISKKVFKKALGQLYKQKRIVLEDGGFRQA